ncbi:MAG: nitrate/nitrite transporter NrtS [Roseivirga sp.]
MLAIKMSLIVGTTLNCINQWECLVNQELDQLNISKLLITYSVPFFVSLYSTSIIKLKG